MNYANVPMCLIQEMDDCINGDNEFLGNPDGKTAQYYKIPAKIDVIQSFKGIYYDSCPDCRKKVIVDTFGSYHCEKCNKSINVAKLSNLTTALPGPA